MIHGTLIIKSNIIKKHLYNEKFYFTQDFELYHRLINLGYEISYDKHNITYKLRVHGDSISIKKNKKQIELYKSILILYNKKVYEKSIINRLYFKIIELCFFIKNRLIL